MTVEKNILVTGATGFLGRWVCRSFPENSNITAISRSKEGRESDISFLKADITDYNTFSRIGGTYDYCLHLAAIPDVQLCETKPLLAYDINFNGTVNTLRFCRDRGIKKIIIASTTKVYGIQKNSPIEEGAGFYPYNYYGLTKALAETYAMNFSEETGMHLLIARIANIYGPDDSSESRLVPNTILSLLNGKQPIVFGDGTARRVFIYVKDAASFLLAALENDNMKGVYNVGTKDSERIIDVVEKLIMISGIEIEPFFVANDKRQNELEVSIGKALKTGWKPIYTFDRGLKETFEWYKERYGVMY